AHGVAEARRGADPHGVALVGAGQSGAERRALPLPVGRERDVRQRPRRPRRVTATCAAAPAARGARTTEWLMSFAQFGSPKDGPADTIVPRTVAPGSTLIQGIGNNTKIAEQANGIVAVGAALNDARAEAPIAFIRRTYPGKPIRFAT